MEYCVTIENLHVTFQTNVGIVKAVNNVSLSLKRGEVFALIGESGSGKSVLGLSILQLLPPNAKIWGNITYKGKNLLTLTKKEMRKIRGKEIGLIPQNPATSLNPVLKVGRQVEEGAKLYRKWGKKQLRAHTISLLERLGFTNAVRNINAYPFQLSGGMKQRVLATIGISGAPQLIIADEPTKGLDAITREKVVQLLRDIVRETKATLLLITHDLHVARAVSDRIGVMYAGQIVEIGESCTIFAAPKHPYTNAFIEALPDRGMKPIPGMPPTMTAIVKGCTYYTRCPYKEDRCFKKSPPAFNVSQTDQKVRCYLYDDCRSKKHFEMV